MKREHEFKQPLFDISNARNFLYHACEQYEQAPAWLSNWLDDVYIRLGVSPREIPLDEILTLSSLYRDGCWQTIPEACNMIGKLFNRLGRDTTGMFF